MFCYLCNTPANVMNLMYVLQDFIIWGDLRNLVLFVQFKNREKEQWRSVTFTPAILLKVTLLHGFF